MSTIYKSKTSMIKGNQVQEPEELLIPIKFFSKEEKEQENQHYQYEKLKHNLKKKITETQKIPALRSESGDFLYRRMCLS